MNMGVETLISVEEYLNTSYDPDVEYVDGVLEERNVGDWLHSLVQVNELVHTPAGPARNLTSPPNFVDWAASTTSFVSVGAYVAAPLSVNLSGHNDPQRLDTQAHAGYTRS